MCTAPYIYTCGLGLAKKNYTYGLWMMMIHEPLSIYVIPVQTQAYRNTMAKTKKLF